MLIFVLDPPLPRPTAPGLRLLFLGSCAVLVGTNDDTIGEFVARSGGLDSLSMGAFDTGPRRVLLPEWFGGLSLPSGLKDFVLFLGL